MLVKVIMIGDVVGDEGVKAIEMKLPALIREKAVDFTVVNGENAAAGFGLTGEILGRLLAAGADVVTNGNHIWEKRDFWPVLEAEPRVLRPANYPPGTVGRGFVKVEKSPGGVSWVVINLQGREFMQPIDCPFRCFDALENLPDLGEPGKRIILVDFHGESPEEKESLGYYLDGRVSLLAGTHTHVQTADARVLPRGTGYITDLGMTGIQESIIGMDPKICLDRARYQVLYRMECAKLGTETKGASLQGVLAHIDSETGRVLQVTSFREPF